MTGAALALLLAVAPPAIVNARLTTRAASAGLATAVEAALGSTAGAQWIGYAVPTEGRQMCCWDGNEGTGRGCCGTCRLEKTDGVSVKSPETPVPLEAESTGLVLLRAEQGRVGRVRMFSAGCAVDAGGLPVLWLTDVAPAQSLRLLAPFADGDEKTRGQDLAEGALAAIALHADPGADEVLEGFTRPGRREHLREQAAFWLGTARGRRGYEVLKDLMRGDASDGLRAHVTFALSQSEVPEALPELIRAARQDASGRVRGQALFWLAQKAGRKAASAITQAIEDDPETAVKEKAVFALSQLPRDEGVPLLIDVARTNRNRHVRERAMFWLGQSNDERALAFIEDVLTR